MAAASAGYVADFGEDPEQPVLVGTDEMLFARDSLRGTLDTRQEEGKRPINGWNPEQLLAAVEQDVVAYLMDRYSVSCRCCIVTGWSSFPCQVRGERQHAADVEHHRAGRHDSTASLIVAHAAAHLV